MKTTKVTSTNHRVSRVLCMVLAILMVLAICPVMALDGDPAVAVKPTYEVWDGKVAGTDKTVMELVASPDVLTITEDVSADLQRVVDKSGTRFGFQVNTAAGFALLSVMTNKPNGFIINGINEELTTADALLGTLTGKISIANNIYLNDPNLPQDQWQNLVLPLWANNVGCMPTGSIFDGQGYMIYGWKVDVSDVDVSQQRGWGLLGNINISGTFIIKNVALIDAMMNVNAINNGKTLLVGGLAAAVTDAGEKGGSKLSIKNCAVSLTFDGTTTGDGDISFGGNQPIIAGGLYATPLFTQHYDPATKEYKSAKLATPQIDDCIVSLDYKPLSGRAGSTIGGLWGGIGLHMRNVLTVDTLISGDLSLPSNLRDANGWEIGWDGTSYGLWSTTKLSPKNFKADTTTVYGAVSNREWVSSAALMCEGFLKEEMQQTFTYVPNSWTTKVFTPYLNWSQVGNTYPVPTVFAENTDVARFLTMQSAREIYTADELIAYAIEANANGEAAALRLMNDLDMTGKTWVPFDNLALFDGQGHTVSNLKIERTFDADAVVGGIADNLAKKTLTDAESKTAIVDYAKGILRSVAFVNYDATFTFTAGTPRVGALIGTHNEQSIISNVYVSGKTTLTTADGTVSEASAGLATFAAVSHGQDGFSDELFIENCVYVGEANAPTYEGAVALTLYTGVYDAGWTNPAKDLYDKQDAATGYQVLANTQQITIKDCYTVLTTPTTAGNTALGAGMGAVMKLENVYATNLGQGEAFFGLNYEKLVDLALIDKVAAVNGNGHWAADVKTRELEQASAAHYAMINVIENAPANNTFYKVKEFSGEASENAMTFSNEDDWTFFADGTPVQSIFADNAAALSIPADFDSIDEFMQESVATLTINGASLRVDGKFPELRFESSVDVAQAAKDKVATYRYGVLILPKVLMEQQGLETITADTEGVFNVVVEESGVSAEGKFLACTGQIPTYIHDGETVYDGREVEFVAVAYFAYKEGAKQDDFLYIYSDAIVRSCVGIANEVCAEGTTESIDVVNKIIEKYQDLDSFTGAQVAE